MTGTPTLSTDLLVVGAGPAGAATAAWAARAGIDVVLADAAVFPRDKTCGDGLTPRAIGELERLGLRDWVRSHTVNQGLRAHGFGQTLHLPWPGGSLPDWGSAIARTELDDHLRTTALKAGAVGLEDARAVDVRREGERVVAVVLKDGREIACRRLVVADGVRSPLGKVLGREWHRDTVYGVAGRCYVASERADDPWISSHLELRGESDEVLSGYGWIFPLGAAGGEVNLGAGTLATAKRPTDVAIKPLMRLYADRLRDEFGLGEELRRPTSALLPMGGAVSTWPVATGLSSATPPGASTRSTVRASTTAWRPAGWSPSSSPRPPTWTCPWCGQRCCATTTASPSRSHADSPDW